MDRKRTRVVLAKLGLDGHDRGVRVIARALRDAGMEVIYLGLWQSPQSVARAAVDEDADVVGISLLSGAHMTLVPRVLEALREERAGDIPVVVGGTIPPEDGAALREMGIVSVFGPGTPIEEITAAMRERQRDRSREAHTTASLVERVEQGDRRALAALITRIDDGETTGLMPRDAERTALRIGITGSAGVGKSSLIGRLITLLRRSGQRLAVLAFDPHSERSGGALLGDRLRMMHEETDEGVFIRSLSTRFAPGSFAPAPGSSAPAAGTPAPRTSGGGSSGGVSDWAGGMVEVCGRAGFDVVLLETIGAGQDQAAVRGLVDALVLVVTPESGDAVQWDKAGLIEYADVVAVNKADLAGADATAASLTAALSLEAGAEPVPVVKVCARDGEGIEALWRAVTRKHGARGGVDRLHVGGI